MSGFCLKSSAKVRKSFDICKYLEVFFWKNTPDNIRHNEHRDEQARRNIGEREEGRGLRMQESDVRRL